MNYPKKFDSGELQFDNTFVAEELIIVYKFTSKSAFAI